MRRLISAFLAACLGTAAFSAVAAVTYVTPDSKNSSPSVIEYDYIASMISKYNADYLQAKNKTELANVDRQDLDDGYKDSVDAYDQITEQVKNLDTQYAALYAVFNDPGATAQSKAEANAGMAKINETMSGLKTQQDTLSKTIDNIQQQRDMLDYNISASSLAATQTFKGKVLTAQQYFLSYYSLGHKRDAAVRKLETLERQHVAAEKKYKMNMISKTEYDKVYDTIKPQQDAIDELNTQIRKSVLNLKTTLGISLSTDSKLGSLPNMDIDQIAARNYPTDLEKYLEKSLTIQSKRDALQNADFQQQYSDTFPYNVESAKIALDQAVATETITFENTYNTMRDHYNKYKTQLKALAASEKELANYKVKLDRGLISKNAYLNKQDEIYMTQCNLKAAKIDLFTELQAYLNSI